MERSAGELIWRKAFLKLREKTKTSSVSKSEDWVCDYWRSMHDDFVVVYNYERLMYDLNECEPPHAGECYTINANIIQAQQNINLTKQLAENDGCDTSGW